MPRVFRHFTPKAFQSPATSLRDIHRREFSVVPKVFEYNTIEHPLLHLLKTEVDLRYNYRFLSQVLSCNLMTCQLATDHE
ncbi:hypothetical protein Pla144_47930 [Bythopirellula polymerisocia]|uniref:Uncharacterized protein n=1 Tax=Bythopirellula polymerisocia TaxID=2528003 RepID=A0A5C6C897_9BACT|nr:hypothetical protein Pla144_47930 [Bythopirellula polymerisocia]